MTPSVESLEQLRASFRSWLDENLPQEWRGVGRHVGDEEFGEVKRAWGVRIGGSGWGAPAWPVEYGGRGLGPQEHAVILEELVAAEAPEPLNASPIGTFGPMVLRHGTEAQKQRYLRPMLDHTEIWCQGFSEPDAGSDLASLQTTMRPDGDGFRINGQKLWTSHAQHADLCYMLVRSSREGPKHAGISLVIVKMDQPGITIRPVKNIARSLHFSEVFFDDVEATIDEVIGPINGGWKIAMEALAFERGLNVAHRIFQLRAEIVDAARILERRDRPADPTVDAVFADRLTYLYLESKELDALIRRILALIGQGIASDPLPNLAKLAWSETHQHVSDLVMEMVGRDLTLPGGDEHLVAHLYSRSATIYAGTSEIQRNVLARSLGLPSSRGGA